jgi:hypothetical protein
MPLGNIPLALSVQRQNEGRFGAMRRRWKFSVLGLLALDAVAFAALGWLLMAARYERPGYTVKNADGGSVAPEVSSLARDPSAQKAAERSSLGHAYRAALEKYRGFDHSQLSRELGVTEVKDAPLSFDPTAVPFYRRVASELQLSTEEERVFAEQGLVSIDHEQRYSMGSAYYAIYARDLPVLVTTDSILHALHRSYDEILKELEVSLFTETLCELLRASHEELARSYPTLSAPSLRESAVDLDLYLSVARSLLQGAGAPGAEAEQGLVRPRLQDSSRVGSFLHAIAELELQRPGTRRSELYGGTRYVDYSQFRPRGHYAESEGLQRYFRAMMWLGREDLGFTLDLPEPGSGLRVDLERERRDAALLSLLIRDAKQLAPLLKMSQLLDFMVGRSDDVTVADMSAAAEQAGVTRLEGLTDATRLTRVREQLRGSVSQPLIRSRVMVSTGEAPDEQRTLQSLQLFGQRFMPDSFVLSRVVYDSVQPPSGKPARLLPTGLDVMAALGNDEAVRLLRPELEKYGYAPNLLAARTALEAQPAEAWKESVVSRWLDALRALGSLDARNLPEVMGRTPWRRKALQTQLASWAELRHDTLLYAKQSYTSVPSCSYPDAYVEPYPALYQRLALLAQQSADFLSLSKLGEQSHPAAFFREFAKTMRTLERLADKELRAEPFAPEERSFLKRTIAYGGGSGPPRYDGWYSRLIYRGGAELSTEGDRGSRDTAPDAWKPSVSDVHTSPGSEREAPRVLEVGVGDVEFLLVAVDNQRDRAAYVGPVYSYYELSEDPQHRLTDQEWQKRIQSNRLPPRPAFSDVFRAPGMRRELGQRASLSTEQDLTLQRLKEKVELLYALAEDELNPLERARLSGFQKDAEALLSKVEDSAAFREKVAALPVLPELEARLQALSKRPIDRAMLEARVKAAVSAARAQCAAFAPATASLRMTVTFTPPSGVVDELKFAQEGRRDTPLGECLLRSFRHLRAPRFGGAPVSMPIVVSVSPSAR